MHFPPPALTLPGKHTIMKIPNYAIFSLLITAFLFTACRPDSNTETDGQGFQAQLQCQTISGDESAPQSAVYAIVNQNKVKIASISVCDSIAPASYEDYGIPAAALAAVGGWWAGAGDYFYAIEEDSAVAFYQGWVDEAQEEDSYHYRKIALFQGGRFNLQLPANRDSIPVQ